MRVRPKITAAVAVGAVTALVAVGGTALASSSGGGSSFLDDFARHLGVAPSKVQTALQQTYQDQLNQLVKEGRLTKAQAQALEQRMKEHAGNGHKPFGFPMFHGRHRFGHFNRRGFGPGPIGGQIQAAAGYLGISGATLLSDLRSGKTLASLATAKGKSVAGLEAAMLAAAEKNIGGAVSKGFLTKAQATKFESFVRTRIDDFVQHGFRSNAAPGGNAHPWFWGGPPAVQS